MAGQRELRVLVATDGSPHAQAAIATTVQFPWPARTRVRALTVRPAGTESGRSFLATSRKGEADRAVATARRALARRWPDVESRVVDGAPIRAILDEARRFRAAVIVLGWRGRGAVSRLLMGSVSRGVVRGAGCTVLVVKQRQRVRKMVVGVDGSAASRRALAFVGRLEPTREGHVTLVSAVELMTVPSRGRVPGAATIASEIRHHNTMRGRAAEKALSRAAAALERRGWPTQTRMVHGEPLRELLGTVGAAGAELLVVGACGTSGVRRLLLGSVAEGALHRVRNAVAVAR